MRLRGMLAGALAMATILTQGSGKAMDGGEAGDAYRFTFDAINGEPLPLERYRGRVLLVVNTASFCGFTPQFAALQKLWETYRDRGLVVIGAPSGDFHQEAEDPQKIAEFCQGAFGVTFPLTAKISVTGEGAHPFYRWANGQAGEAGAVRWNFHKFLVAADGALAAYFPTRVAPDAREVIEAIEEELAKVERPAG